ncbi:hypothetical protein ACHAWF_013647 [Thalassiosira exigua]
MRRRFLLLLAFATSRRAATEEPPPGGCSGEDGTCTAPEIIRRNDDGSTTLLAQTYPPGPDRYGFKVSRHASKIQSWGAASLARLDASAASDPASDELRRAVFDVSTVLVEELLSLASVHKEEWTQALLDVPSDYDDEEYEEEEEMDETERRYADDHFAKASNAYEATLAVYARLWDVMTPEAFAPLDREAISAGQSSAYFSLADMFHQRYNGLSDVSSSSDCSTAYRYLLQSEAWCDTSLSILGLSLVNEGDRVYMKGIQDEETDAVANEVFQTIALTKVRLGALLVDMHATGYALDANGNLRLQPADSVKVEHVGGRAAATVGEDQRRILDMALEKLSTGSLIYSELAENSGRSVHRVDYRLNLGDSCHYMGLAFSNLFRWDDAVEQLETAMLLYDALFEEYHAARMIDDALEVASGMIQTTQSLWEAHLNLEGKTDDAKKAFHRHLLLRRFYRGEISLEEPLDDEEGEEDDDSLHQPYDGAAANSPYHEELQSYQSMLDEYTQQQSEYPPDGSYYEMEFDYDGGNVASYIEHDRVYEGTLRSAIGSLQLAMNDLWAATGELQVAVALLRDGDRDYFEAYGDDGSVQNYPVKLELANALLNLAYAQLGLKKWSSSYESFQEAMHLFESELKEGETPNNHSGGANGGQSTSWGEKLTSFFGHRLTSSAGGDDNGDRPSRDEVVEEEASVGKGDSSSQFISLDGFPSMEENITMSS